MKSVLVLTTALLAVHAAVAIADQPPLAPNPPKALAQPAAAPPASESPSTRKPPKALSEPAPKPAAAAATTKASAGPHPFDVRDLVMLDRVSDPQVSPDGKWVAYQLRETDYAANKGNTGLWLLSLTDKDAKPRALAK